MRREREEDGECKIRSIGRRKEVERGREKEKSEKEEEEEEMRRWGKESGKIMMEINVCKYR